MSESINFFSEQIPFIIRKRGILREWIADTAKSERTIAGDINFIFCDDAYLHKLNKNYLKHDTLTDIITFPLMDDDCVISGDIYISIERVRENAKIYKQPVFTELARVMIHGILHLLGYKDETLKEKEKMRKMENHYLELLNNVLN